MTKMIFINLPVRDVSRSTAFYEAIGARKNENFSDDSTSCMVFSETIFAMLMTHEKFSQFNAKPIADAKKTNEALFAINADSREEVDALLDKIAAAGGKPDPSPLQDHGFMYSRSFEDPDGHFWEHFWMDPEAAKG